MTFDEWFEHEYDVARLAAYKKDLRAAWKAGFEEGAGVGGDNMKAADGERLAKGLR